MFKNPIKKYQSGGVTPEQARQQVIQFIIQKTGATEDQVNGFLDKISGDEKALGEFQQILELASKDDPEGIDMLKQLFGTQSSQFAKKGGKLHNFICKHAKGGVAGCGCKEDGGKVSKAQNGTSGIPQNAAALDTYLMSNMQMPYSDNLFTGQQVANLINKIHLTQPLVQAQEDGGKVEKAEEGIQKVPSKSPRPGNINVPTIAGILAEIKQRKTVDSGNATNRNFSKVNWRGNQYFLERANIDGNTVDTWVQVTPNHDTLVQQQLPSGRYTPLTQEQAQSIVNRNRSDINKEENGGVVKGQGGIPEGMPSPYVNGVAPSSGEIRPDSTTNPIRKWINRTVDNSSALREASRYARNFGNSAMGKALGFFMPDFNNGAVGAVTPGFKVIPEGKVGSLRRQNYDPFTWEVMANDPVVKENARKLGIKEGSKEWAKFLESETKKLFDLINE